MALGKGNEKHNNKLIVVLGMHRSGTGAIKRGHQVMAVDLRDRHLPAMCVLA
jgi:hypothetical protein